MICSATEFTYLNEKTNITSEWAKIEKEETSKVEKVEVFENEKQFLDEFLQTKSAESFSGLFKTLYPQILKYFLARSLERMTAEELSQNVMFTLYEKVGDLREKELFFGWLFKIARNEWLQHVRNQQRREQIAQFKPLEHDHADKMFTEIETPLNSQFHDWMNYLEQDEREILMLRFIDGLSYEELAVALDIPIGTVKWRIFNAKKKLTKVITELGAINND